MSLTTLYRNRQYDPLGSELSGAQQETLSDYVYAIQKENEYLYITPMVIDLIDTFNQRGTSPKYPMDRVSGYTLNQIAAALKGAGNLDDWKHNLAKLDNPTKVYLDEYFNQYFEDRPTKTSTNTILKIKSVAGVGYTVDWIKVYFKLGTGSDDVIYYKRDVSVGDHATIVVPDGATNIRIEAKPLASYSSTRIFNKTSVASGQTHCFHLTGAVNDPKYKAVDCSAY